MGSNGLAGHSNSLDKVGESEKLYRFKDEVMRKLENAGNVMQIKGNPRSM